MTFFIGLCLGLFLGWAVNDLLTTESKITYHIKRLRAKDGGVITVDAKAKMKKQTRAERRAARKNK